MNYTLKSILITVSILLAVFLSVRCSAGQLAVTSQCDEAIAYQAYTVCYSNKYKSPVFSSYTVTPAMIDAPVIKGRPSFHIDRHIPKQYRASNNDYSNSGYDKGHIAPNSALNYDKKTQRETFTLSNAAPQIVNFNRVLWRKIERHVRGLALTHIVGVVTGVCHSDKHLTIGRNGISVPDAFFKLVRYDNTTILYYAKNTPHKNTKIADYVITINEFDKLCNGVNIK